MNRKAIYILGGLLVLILALGGYLLFGKKKPADTTNPPATQDQTTNTPTDNNTNSDSESATETVTKLSDTKAVSPAFSYTGNALWYATEDGHMYTINLNSGLKKEYVLPSNLSVSKIIWPSAGDDFIIVTDTSAAGRTFNYYDSVKKTFTQYPKNIRGVDFTRDGKGVIYNWVTDKNLSGLTQANPDTSEHTALMDLPDGDYDVKISPLGDKAFVYQYKNSKDGKLGYIDLTAKKLITIATGMDNSAIWSPDGTKFLFNKPETDGAGDDLWLGDLSSTTGDKNLGVKAVATKAFFSADGQSIYVGVDKSLWKISAKDQKKTKVLDSSSSVSLDPKSLLISNDGKVAYIWNSDGFLYRAELTQ